VDFTQGGLEGAMSEEQQASIVGMRLGEEEKRKLKTEKRWGSQTVGKLPKVKRKGLSGGKETPRRDEN